MGGGTKAIALLFGCEIFGLQGSLGFAVDEPGDSEGIDDDAEAGGPEGFFEGEDDSAASGEGVKDAFGFGDALDLKGEGEAAGLLVAVGGDVASHENLAGDGDAGVHDFVRPVGWDLAGEGAAAVTKDFAGLAAEGTLVEFEGGLAVTVEAEIGV